MNKRFAGALLVASLVAAGCGKQDAAEPAQPAAAPPSAPVDVTAAPPGGATVVAEATDAAVADSSANAAAAGDASAPAAAATASAETASATPAAPAATPVAAPANPPPAAAKTATPVAAAPSPARPAPAASTSPAAANTAQPSAAGAAASGDPGTLVRADSLRARNAADAPELAALAAGIKVKILARDGAWYQVNADGKTGWVRMMSVRRSAAASTDVAGLAGIASGRTGTGKVVTTTGVRGLDSGDLTAASFDEARIARAEAQRVSRADADAFARQAGLVTQAVPALPAPAK